MLYHTIVAGHPLLVCTEENRAITYYNRAERRMRSLSEPAPEMQPRLLISLQLGHNCVYDII